MFAFIYLCICVLLGAAVFSYVYPQIFQKDVYAYNRKKVLVSPVLLWFPACAVVGILLLTWTVYILARSFYGNEHALLYANIISMIFYTIISVVLLKLKQMKSNKTNAFVAGLSDSSKYLWVERGFFLCCFLFVLYLMYYTFHIKDRILYVGGSVCGDFAVHLSMIRSFSWGDNFYTGYTLYAGEDIRYHFMYQFWVGNLEFLGLRIDHALNISSALTMIFASMLLYVLTVKISAKNRAGYIAVLLFYFRSSESFFHYVAETPTEESLKDKLLNNGAYIGYTPNENWGIWGWNVFANQRHLAISLSVALLVVILVLPKLYETFRCFRTLEIQKVCGPSAYIKECFFTKGGWKVKDYRLMILLGILAGASAFFNGAVFIALILMVFFIAALSKNRLDFLIFAGIAGALSLVQSNTFIYGDAVSPEYYFGFLAEAKTFWGVLYYLIHLLGILVVVLGAAFMHYRGVNRYLLFVFLTPAVLTFTVKMTNDINVNHKYLFISCMMLDVIAAAFVADLIQKREYIRNFCVGILVIMLTSTGIYDIHCLKKQNVEKTACKLSMEDPVSLWIKENTDSSDIFLTPPYVLNRVTAAGAMLYQGYQYVCWSAGYDTAVRDAQVAAMYSASSSEELKNLIAENDIAYIIVDADVRVQERYLVNEEVIASTYASVYTEGEGKEKFTIYDTAQILQ
ncbi:MAG: hypothetical protein K2M46_00485 [Lachnospiraceae bacterium]|nr:hypothetical protein [Lachnospiraceae bacterium]